MNLTVALIGFVAVGVALGLLGGGGSILAVPVLVNVLGISAKVAVPMSLPVVGIAAGAGAIARWRAGQIRLRIVAPFAACTMLASYTAARLGREIPDRPRLIMFGTVMLVAAFAMWRRSRLTTPASQVGHAPHPMPQIILAGLGVGTLTGLVGIGGGFLIVPTLAGVLGLPMPEATAKSLAVIALNAAAAGAGFWANRASIDFTLTLYVTAAALAGMAIGTRIAPRFSSRTLTRAFAGLLVLLALFMLGKEFTR